MAKETVSLNVHPSQEQKAINTYNAFGWDFFSSQEILSKDTHLETQQGLFGVLFDCDPTLYSITETNNYVKLVFQREKTMPNYVQLVQLEKQFNELNKTYPKPPKPPRTGLRLLGIIPLIYKFVIYPKKIKKFKESYGEISAEQQKIIDKASQLL